MTRRYLCGAVLIPLIPVMLCLSTGVSAQDADPTIEDLVDIGDGMTDFEDLDRLEALRQAPLDLNTAARADLEQLPWLTPQQVAAILARRNRNGRFSSVDALRGVPGIDGEQVERLRPFLTARAAQSGVGGRWRITANRRARDAANGTGWLGMQTDMRTGTRFRWGIRGERSAPGTTFRWRSGWTEVRHISWLDRMVVGHYALEYGRGLIFGGFQRRRIDGLGSPVKWRPRGVVPARSSGPGRYVGAVLDLRTGALHLTTILARTRTEGRIHGLRGAWIRRTMTLGGTIAVHTVRDKAGQPRTIRRYGLDADILIGAANMFGEVVRDDRGNTILAAGVHWTMGALEGGTVISRENQPADGRTPAVRSSPQDHHMATTIRYRPDRRTLIVLTHDIRPGYAGTFSPMAATRTLRIRRRLSRFVAVYGLWQNERMAGMSTGRESRTGFQGQVDWNLMQRLRLRGRAERRTFHAAPQKSGEREYRILADLRYQAAGQITWSGQWSRTYGTRATPPLSDTASLDGDIYTRWSIFTQTRVAPGMDVSVRYAQTRRIEPIKTVPRRSEVTWSVQITGAW